MIIEGPFTIKVIENQETVKHQLEIQFKKEFSRLSTAEQNTKFSQYLAHLKSSISNADKDSPNQQGLLTILQFSESIYPYICAGEALLDETIIIEIEQTSAIVNLLNSKSSEDDALH